jgi:hypothetical protein
MKRRHDKAAVVAVGPDVEDDYKRQYCERKLAKAGIRQRSASRGPAEPVAVSPLRLVTQQDIVQRLGAAAALYQRRTHGEMVVVQIECVSEKPSFGRHLSELKAPSSKELTE